MFDWVFGTPSAFLWLEVFHVLGFSLWVGSIFILDLKLLGLIKRAPFYRYHLVPWAYLGLGLVLLTGFLFVAGDPYYLENPALQIKLGLVVAAGVFVMVFHQRLVDTQLDAASDAPVPAIAKVAAATSLILWLGVLIMARMIPYQY